VDYINNSEMNTLTGPEYEFKVKYHVDLEMTEKDRIIRIGYTKEQIQTELMYLQSNLRCDEVVKIKIGCQVMCIVNIELSNGDILCNGAQGIVTGLSPDGNPIVKYKNGYQMTMAYHVWSSENIPGLGVSQIPLILAWALTIHKAQGSTLEIAEVDAGASIFECGQTYVALSRVKNLEGLYLSSFDARRIRINRKVQEFYEILSEENAKRKTEEENAKRELEMLPEAYAEGAAVPIVEATLIPIAIAIPENIFSDFELKEENYD
jgi:ATP-dependent DNA helicase PIF1